MPLVMTTHALLRFISFHGTDFDLYSVHVVPSDDTDVHG